MRYWIKAFNLKIILILIMAPQVFAQSPGYFKDIFSDGGVNLTSDMYLDAAESLDLTVEYLATSDVDLQTEVMISNEFDSNGHLLYPDGAPRFRMIYTNGGRATLHGTSLGEHGRDRVRAFYTGGGSYAGSCAGMFIASLHYEETGVNNSYYHIWPGRTEGSGVLDSYTGHTLPQESPLLNYYNFGNDGHIANVRHNGGGWAREHVDFPENTVILARYDAAQISLEMHGKASTWAYKPDSTQGRIVVTGSHPEGASSGEILNMMQAILLYALDGTGVPSKKATLNNGESRIMDLYSEDSLPAYTRIGDRQYHHFTINVPPGTPEISIEMYAEPGFDFNLYANPGTFAFEGDALHTSANQGPYHIMSFQPSEPGLWYMGVECATTVDPFHTSYSGQVEVLNGVAYEITANWDVVDVADGPSLPADFKLYQNYPNPFNPSTTINYELPGAGWVNLVVYDVNGHEVASIINGQGLGGLHSLQWTARDHKGASLEAGIYLFSMRFRDAAGGTFSEVKKFTVLK